ncbi:uncharacterized protein LOC135929947 [Gordionus sp. m RMFG-2023]|uniref:uncharacterized protein LOC135929947 n=1 Tax=Gordionus sp. m RMFG-2023 TaxID=3053472 RepID=UPI0031FD8100
MSLKFITFAILAFLGLKIVEAQNDKCVIKEGIGESNTWRTIASIYRFGAKDILTISNCKGTVEAYIARNRPITMHSVNGKSVVINSGLNVGDMLDFGPAQTQGKITEKGKIGATVWFKIAIDNRNKDLISFSVGKSPFVLNLSFKKD